MYKHIKKTVCMLTAVLMIASPLSACKKGGDSDSASSSASGKTASSSAVTSTGTPSKSAATGSNKPVSSTSQTGTTTVSEGKNDEAQPGQAAVAPGEALSENIPITTVSNEAGLFIPEGTVIDLKGREFVIANRDAMPVENDPSVIKNAFYKSMMDAQQKYNFKLVWNLVSGGTDVISNDFINATMAGIKYADIVSLSTKQAFPTVVDNKLLTPLDQYVDFNNPLYNTNYIKTAGAWRGKIYGFPCAFSSPHPVYPGGTGVFYNRDIFDREGLPRLEEVVDRGEWTWDKMLELAQQTTKDLNSDGVVDQWGIEYNRSDYLGMSFMFSNGVDFIKTESNGKFTFTMSDPRTVRAMAFMSDLTNVYKVATKQNSSFKNGSAAMLFGDKLASGNVYKDLNMNFGLVPLPKGADVDTYQVYNENATLYSVPINADASISVPIFVDMMTIWSPEKPYAVTFDDFLTSYMEPKYNSGDIPWIKKYFNDPKVSNFLSSFNGLPKLMDSSVFKKVLDQAVTPGAAVDSVREPGQALLDSMVVVE